MATVTQKIDAERCVRELLAGAGVPPPDYVEYGFTCIRLAWLGPRLIVRLDIDEEGGPMPVVLIDIPHPSQPPLPELGEEDRVPYDPLRLLEASPSVN